VAASQAENGFLPSSTLPETAIAVEAHSRALSSSTQRTHAMRDLFHGEEGEHGEAEAAVAEEDEHCGCRGGVEQDGGGYPQVAASAAE